MLSLSLTRTPYLVVMLLLTLVGCGGDGKPAASMASLLAYDRPDTNGLHAARDIPVPMRDGFPLTCDLYRPAGQDGAPVAKPVPVIINSFEAYGRAEPAFGTDARPFARKGYAVLRCNTRGAQGVGGNSPARVAPVNPFSPQEQEDNYDLIEWAAAQAWSDGQVGQIGQSYGAITALAVAARQPPHLKAIVPMMGALDIYRQFSYPGGMVAKDDRGAWPRVCDILTGDPTCARRIPTEWAAHPHFDSYWSGRRADTSQIKIPTLYVGGTQDFFAPSFDAMHLALGASSFFASILGPWDHTAPELAETAPLPLSVSLAWFDRWLRGDTSVPEFPRVAAYDPVLAHWSSHDVWPPSRSGEVRYHLRSDSTLSQSPEAEAQVVSYQVVPGSATTGIDFTSPPFSASTTVAGSVRVVLRASFSASDGALVASLQDVAPNGAFTSTGVSAYRMVSSTLSETEQRPLVPGQVYRVELNVPSREWTFKQGHRLRIRVSSEDESVGGAPAGVVNLHLGSDASYVLMPQL